MRLALVYALLDKRQSIGIEHLRAALALWAYCQTSAKSIFFSDNNPLTPLTEEPLPMRLLDAISKTPGISRTGLYEATGRNVKASAMTEALAWLEASRLAHAECCSSTGGRPGECWYPGEMLTKKRRNEERSKPEPEPDLSSFLRKPEPKPKPSEDLSSFLRKPEPKPKPSEDLSSFLRKPEPKPKPSEDLSSLVRSFVEPATKKEDELLSGEQWQVLVDAIKPKASHSPGNLCPEQAESIRKAFQQSETPSARA
jgi:hypothetical protein